MDRQQLGTKLTLDALGIPLTLESFEDRLTVQKSVYLAQAAGVDCGYFFRWYLRGPYCPELTRDAFGIAGQISAGLDESSEWTLSDGAKAKLEKVKSLIQEHRGTNTSRWVELLSSVHFLVERGQVRNVDVGQLVQLLAKCRKRFSESEVTEAINGLRNNGLLAA